MRIALLFGGTSAERDVSLKSGAAVEAALKSREHYVTCFDPADTNLNQVDWTQFDLVFLALHGAFGEDGSVQSILENANIPFTGSSAAVSRLAFSKSATKNRLIERGIPTPEYVLLSQADRREEIEKAVDRIGFPLVVKPDAQGSSLGVALVHSTSDLNAALSKCFELDERAILERAIIGSEWTIGWLDDQRFPLVKIESDRLFFDHQAKYYDDKTRFLLEFALAPGVHNQIKSCAEQTRTALGTRGLSRLDVMLDQNQKPWVLEMNTIPGMTDKSLAPLAAKKMGWSFEELCDRTARACL